MWFDAEIEVIPAVDVLSGEAVRLYRGDYETIVEQAGHPADLAARWAEAGARRIHLVDLDGARSGAVQPALVHDVARRIAPTPLQASGGIRSLGDARALLAAGADRVVVGTAAWPDPAPWFELGEALVLAIDVRDGELRTKGWTDGTGLTFDEAAARAGGARALVTAIDRDGTLAGPDLELVARAAHAGLKVVAAGGIRTPDDIEALAAAGAEAAVVGRALLYSPATSRRTKTR
jgi:phosphoribosylformimino-5-aminoimidazole carboxamide ribotide isomerase